MNVFEDLIEELKEENLIEQTVIETSSFNSLPNQVENNLSPTSPVVQTEALNQESPKSNFLFDPNSILQELNLADPVAPTPPPPVPTPQIAEPVSNKEITDEMELAKLFAEAAELEESAGSLASSNLNSEEKEFAFENNGEFPEAVSLNKPVVNENEFFRRRATEEVNSLQIVEHIISAIEKEQMKIVPKIYDDISVKMALHDFLKITETPQSAEHAKAEFKLMQETESWYSALAHRDKHISIGDLRRYCENARPALSSQALVSLARFYRNSPFSEAVRNKFDVVITKLLTKEVFPDKREVIFERDELIKHLSGLYADWSSIPLYETDNDSDVLLATLKIEEYIEEAKNAQSFEDLIKTDFFNRLRLFKEGVGEKFFSPLLTATAIECNVIVGNKYVDLVGLERQKNNSKTLEEKYQFFLDQTVSDATSKTLQLVEVLKEKKQEVKAVAKTLNEQTLNEREVLKIEPKSQSYKKSEKKKSLGGILGINKWLLTALILTIVGVGGLYIYVEHFTEQMKPSPSVVKVNLENSSLQEYFKTARINRGTFFAVVEPAWNGLSKDVKEDVLKKTLAVGSEKGYNKIHLMNTEGKTVGYASDQGVDLEPK